MTRNEHCYHECVCGEYLDSGLSVIRACNILSCTHRELDPAKSERAAVIDSVKRWARQHGYWFYIKDHGERYHLDHSQSFWIRSM